MISVDILLTDLQTVRIAKEIHGSKSYLPQYEYSLWDCLIRLVASVGRIRRPTAGAGWTHCPLTGGEAALEKDSDPPDRRGRAAAALGADIARTEEGRRERARGKCV